MSNKSKKKINLLPDRESYAATGYINIIDDPAAAKDLGDVEFLIGNTFTIEEFDEGSCDEIIYNKEINKLSTDDVARFIKGLERVVKLNGNIVLFYNNTRLAIHNVDFNGTLDIADVWSILYNGRQTAIDHEFIMNLLSACSFEVTNIIQVGEAIYGKFRIEATRRKTQD